MRRLRFGEAERRGVFRAIAERRDVRRFRPDSIGDELLERLLEAAHRAPSVGLMQPWRFVVVREAATKAAMQGLAARERLIQSEHLDDRARQYLDLKLEGIREAPVSVVVCCDREPGKEILGRHTIPDADLYSTCLAIENLWLAARAEGVGVGWVSFYREDDLRDLLGIPSHVVPVAWLCIGYPDERHSAPGLGFRVGGGKKSRSTGICSPNAGDAAKSQPQRPAWSADGRPRRVASGGRPRRLPSGRQGTARSGGASWRRRRPRRQQRRRGPRPRRERRARRSRSEASARSRRCWNAGRPRPPAPPSRGRHRPAILVLAADHGVAAHRVSLYPTRVSGQVAGAAARGGSAIGVLARARGAAVVVADLGLRGPHPPGVRP